MTIKQRLKQKQYIKNNIDEVPFDMYQKTIKKVVTYSDKNDKDVFDSVFEFGLFFIVDGEEVVDSYIQALNPFMIRTKQDKKTIDEILYIFQTDANFILEEPEYACA